MTLHMYSKIIYRCTNQTDMWYIISKITFQQQFIPRFIENSYCKPIKLRIEIEVGVDELSVEPLNIMPDLCHRTAARQYRIRFL